MVERYDTWTGGEHYWIRWHEGQHQVRRETYGEALDNETVFSGHYEDCVKWIDEQVAANVEYDHNL